MVINSINNEKLKMTFGFVTFQSYFVLQFMRYNHTLNINNLVFTETFKLSRILQHYQIKIHV